MSKIKLLYDSWENLPLGLFQEINITFVPERDYLRYSIR